MSYLNKYCPIISLLVLFICGNAYALQGSTAENGSNVQAVHSLGITGTGVNVGLISVRNVRTTHQAFNDSNGPHVFNFDYSGSGINYTLGPVAGHDTWVTGIIASRGWTGHPNDVGVAPACDVYSARVFTDSCSTSSNYIKNAFNEFIHTYNCRVFVIPFQLSGTANGLSTYSLMVDYFAYNDNVILALASGNDLPNPSIFGDAYNGITAAALTDDPNDVYSKIGSKSNPGPTIDGRRKPEISCPGSRQTTPSIGSDTASYTTARDGATSFAIPQTGGVAALLLEYADNSPELDDDRNVVIKAVIVNSTFPNIRDKSGKSTDPANRVWDPNRGYGRIDGLRAFNTLSAGRVSKGTAVITSSAGWAYDTMGDSATDTYLIKCRKNERLVLTATWNRKIDIDDSIYEVNLPLFNLDVTVKNPSGDTVFAETDDVNNLEKIDLLLSADGNYTVLLYNSTSKNREYGLAFELLEPLIGDFNMDYAANKKDLKQMSFDWLNTDVETGTNMNSDSRVNYLDFAIFAKNWMKTDRRYYNP